MYSAIERQQMLSAAKQSIKHGINRGTRIEINHLHYAKVLLDLGACFVTIKTGGLLRGCIGSLTAKEPLIDNLTYNAYSSAFHDPRFLPLNREEYAVMDIEISILSVAALIQCSSESELIDQLTPNIDGLTLRDGEQSATFLPSVWSQLVEPDNFVMELKRKAGFSDQYWSDTITAEKFTVQSITQ
jgi:AmmeMemoRadiSam system protein A